MGRQSHVVKDTVRGKIPDWLRRRSRRPVNRTAFRIRLIDRLSRTIDSAKRSAAINRRKLEDTAHGIYPRKTRALILSVACAYIFVTRHVGEENAERRRKIATRR